MANNSQRGLSWIVWLLIGILVIALLLPLVVKVGGGYYRWGFGKSTKEEVVFQCPPCPECEPEVIYKEVQVPQSESEPSYVSDDYVCKAINIGPDDGPVEEAGSCSYCTINYSKPGPVWVVGKEPMEYTAGAHVWQYREGTLEDYLGCIEGQPFRTKPELLEAYQPVYWPAQ